ncbi:MAG: DUF2520 domain-containing protein [Flavobacteriales bacterium]
MERKIGIIGTGNVAWHLIRLFAEAGHPISFIGGRLKTKAALLAEEAGITAFDTIENIPADITHLILAVNDDAIEELSSKFSAKITLIHTSGSASIEALKSSNKGVIWTIQTLKKNQPTSYKNIPIILEFTDDTDAAWFEQLFKKVSPLIYKRNSEERMRAHLAAVVTNNFVNHLYAFSEDLMQSSHLPFSLLFPIIEEETKKIKQYSPSEIQTGPAARGDQKTIDKHLHMLQNSPEYKELYALMSALIQKKKND